MITYNNTLGRVSLTNDYFAELVSEIAKECYGVAGMAPRGTTDSLKSLILGKDFREKGVKVYPKDGRLVIDLHIQVGYGLNISTITQSISHRVRNEVETSTGLKVARINVHVDGIIGD